jgi:hypothetical protein
VLGVLDARQVVACRVDDERHGCEHAAEAGHRRGGEGGQDAERRVAAACEAEGKTSADQKAALEGRTAQREYLLDKYIR